MSFIQICQLLLLGSLPFTLSLHIPCALPKAEFRQFRRLSQPPVPTPAPVLHKELLRRDTPGTCGSITTAGYAGDGPPVCSGPASICSFASHVHSADSSSVTAFVQGCCEDTNGDSCTFYTGCRSYGGNPALSILLCPSAAPSCSTYVLTEKDFEDYGPWTGFACGSNWGTIEAFASSGAAGLPHLASAAASTSAAASSSIPSATSAYSAVGSTTPTSPTSTSSSPESESDTEQGPTKHYQIGAIAGGVVGGVLVSLGLLGLFAWWWRHHEWENPDDNLKHRRSRQRELQT